MTGPAVSKTDYDVLLDYLQRPAPRSLLEYFREMCHFLQKLSPESDVTCYVLAPPGLHQVSPESRYVVGSIAKGSLSDTLRQRTAQRFFTATQIEGRHRGSERFELALHLDEAQFDAALIIAIDVPALALSRARDKIKRALVSRLVVAIHSIRNSYRSKIVSISLTSKDLTSFLHKTIQNLIVPCFDVEAASIFYTDEDKKQLILGATTGIVEIRRGRSKRSDVRYFIDSRSATAACFRASSILVEDMIDQSPMHVNSHAEDVAELRSRVYLPLKVYSHLVDKRDDDDLCGVVRLVNFNCHADHKPFDVVECSLLSYAVEISAILAKRYVRAMNLVHDQERATHGYVTDLSTIKMNAEVVGFYANALNVALEQVEGGTSGQDTAKIALAHLARLQNANRTIASVQEYMAEQLGRILQTNQNRADLDSAADEICVNPFTSVFMRIDGLRRGMSTMFNRSNIVFTSKEEQPAAGKDDTQSAAKGEPPALARAIEEGPLAQLRSLPAIKIGSSALFSIVRNIVENAIKYSQEDETPRIEISWKVEGGMLILSFRDYGIGISESEQKRLFRDGFRGREARRLQLRGNGIGLFLSIEKARRAGADLIYERPRDRLPGSLFRLIIPTYKG